MTQNDSTDLPELALAIIGMDGRFPAANNVTELWQNLVGGAQSIRPLSDEELQAAGVSSELRAHPDYVKVGATVADIDLFDATFFGFSPREAETMDPQTRLFLQCAWNALEDAGYTQETYKGLVGVFAGKHPSTYMLNNLISNPEVVRLVGELQVSSGNDHDALAPMVAYKLDLKGPTVSVQTFCSTSLVAVHLACQSLLAYECDMALAGGVAIHTPQETGYLYQPEGIFSPDGVCRTFDGRANGMVMGNGLGVVVLKRLEEAIADGDHVYAVIRGSAMNNDGLARVGFTAPSVNGQAAVIAAALASAGVDAGTISYVETHGTGTALGDSVELRAMMKAFQQSTTKKRYCAIGSIKPNIGHLDRASGVTGLIKVALALKHKILPPSLNFERSSPDINLDDSPFYVNTTATPWPASEQPRRAGVSSFGLGGTNAHVVLEEAPAVEASGPSRPYQLLLLSTKTAEALEIATSNLAMHLQQNAEPNGTESSPVDPAPLADIAYTLQRGRSALNHRRMVVCRNREDAAEALSLGDPRRVLTVHQTYRNRPVAFLFPGVGDHYPDMARQLYQAEPVFAEWVDRCCQLLQPYLGLDLRTVLYPDPSNSATAAPNGQPAGLNLRQMLGRECSAGAGAPAESDPLQQTSLAQPAVFVVEYALAQLLLSWGIRPGAMIGYSLGEYVAACLAGVLSLEDALLLVARRAELIQALETGSMLTVALAEAEIQPLINGRLAVSGMLTPSLSVVAGPTGAITMLREKLAARGVAARLLPPTHAFHSPMMAPIVEPFTELVGGIALRAPQIPYLSNVTGEWIAAAEATDPTYWSRHLCQPVRFADGIGRLLENQEQVLVEIGPGQSLGSFVRQHPACDSEQAARIVATMRYVYDEQPDSAFLLKTLGKLWLAGIEIDWSGFYRDERRALVSLPTYPFARHRYWIEAGSASKTAAPAIPRETGKNADIGRWFYQPIWKQSRTWTTADAVPEGGNGCWLLFMDEFDCGELVASRLEQAGHQVVKAYPGTRFAQLEANAYTLDPISPEDYRHLLKTLPSPLGHVVHLWGINSLPSAEPPAERFAQAQRIGFYSLLNLIKSVDQYADSLSLWAVTSNARCVTATETLCPEKATIWSLCRVITQENLNIRSHCVDVIWPEANQAQQRWLAGQLVTEFTRAADALAVAYRGNRRWISSYEPLSLPPPERAVLRQNGIYLVTGGLGAIGMILARYLVDSAQARVILTTRSTLPPREAWSDWLASHSDDDGISRRIRALQALETRGGQVRVMQADAADEAGMAAVVDQIIAEFGTLHGVFHAAGISGKGFFAPVQELTAAQCEAHFGPKAYGLYVLEKVLAGHSLDFCLVFSSLASVLGGLGFGAYAPANDFIDVFTQQHNLTHSQPWCSVNWDTWRTRDDLHDLLGATVAAFEMPPEEAIQALERIIASGAMGQIVNSTGDLEMRLNQWVRLLSIHDLESRVEEASLPHPRPALMAPYEPPTNEVEERIAAIWQELLGIEPIGINDNFMELGGHSLIAIQVISRLRQLFQVNLSLSLVLMAPTIAELAIAVEMAIIEELEVS